MQGVKMNAVAKRVSDAVMDKVTHELKPDIPTHNRLKRSWEEHEKNKQHHARNLKKEIAKIQEKVSLSIKSLASEPAHYDVNPRKESWPLTGIIPGFRYRSNGDERKGLYDDDPRRLRLVKISPGVKYVMGKTKRDDSPGTSKATLVRPSLDHVNKSDINVEENDNSGDLSSHQLRKNIRSTGLLDDDAVFRSRKVQEQLGLHRKPSHTAA
ncbi:uncharacterized protein [Littorina saxatilis]|uniref:Uncharacterized protein n=1 Tax=Littorina saxatilis TaxID=31220 RepID=A0AAN9BLD7_9CAEN